MYRSTREPDRVRLAREHRKRAPRTAANAAARSVLRTRPQLHPRLELQQLPETRCRSVIAPGGHRTTYVTQTNTCVDTESNAEATAPTEHREGATKPLQLRAGPEMDEAPDPKTRG